MYKVLIVDDEQYIREGLKTLIPWENAGFLVCDAASNGIDAIEKHKTKMPHLMIIDIRMPGMNGLELIERVRKEDPNVHFLILSGYADFDNAKRAMTYTVDSYILKPVDQDELLDYLHRLRSVLDGEQENKREKMKIGLIQALHSGTVTPELVEHAIRHDLMLNTCQVLVIELSSEKKKAEKALYRMEELLKEHFEASGRGEVVPMGSYTGILLNEDIIREEDRKALYSELIQLLGSELDFCAAIGNPVHSLTDVVHSYQKCIDLLAFRFFMPGEDLLHIAPDFPSSEQEVPLDLEEFSQTLVVALDVGDMEAAQKCIISMGDGMVQAGYREQDMKLGYAQIISTAINKLLLSLPTKHDVIQDARGRIVQLYQQQSRFDLNRFATRLLSDLNRQIKSSNGDTSLKQLIEFIQRNYHKNLKLESLADSFNYNNAYLGKIFKNYTGEPFRTYLDKVRMDRAKSLLEQGYKVYKVAELVGFPNVDYFHFKFRKYVGCSPSDYRKAHSLQ